jgi:hypothetical protein
MRLLLAMLLMFPLMGCAVQIPISEINTQVCQVWKPVSWSSKDTDQTIREIKVNNARRGGWCEGQK